MTKENICVQNVTEDTARKETSEHIPNINVNKLQVKHAKTNHLLHPPQN